MKILFLTDNFPPEVNAPATRTYEHCKEWVKEGVEVTIITCAPNFPEGKVFGGYKNKLFQKEEIDGINVVRVWSYISANKGFVKRILDYVSFMVSSFIAGLFIKSDLIVATSPQFFTAISGRWLSFWKRKYWIMEVRDLWPESIKAVGAMKDTPAIKFFEYLERRMYKSAHKIVVVTDTFKVQLTQRHNIETSKVMVVKNGMNLQLFKPQEKPKELLERLNLDGKFVIGYIGTHGMAHALDFILKSASKISNQQIHFLFIGSGAKKEELELLKSELKLNNVSMIGLVPKNEIKDYISILDVSLVNLKKSDTFKSVIPSKIFESVAMHKPILLGVEGESKKLVLEYKIGEVFEPENESDFLDKVHLMLNQPKDYREGFHRLKEDFDRKKLAFKMLDFLKA
ncbi:glycosyltransferase family 4 protein [Hyunsoonleella sp. SJ7]|uniref:Glycosyltransferase family 4 protein n=1 Tax=Hyunsoonleella aquatilis TaxID=2762758 RepID=A0A923KIF9_9FLAO|nr:glycosyltransferase family 4 protein [Hyunsoonleella aquatilis]MBC3758484.1 glycosyltransferase family 4 protein [Hyunsoonleella aquatilis]